MRLISAFISAFFLQLFSGVSCPNTKKQNNMYVAKYKIEEANEAIGERGAIWDKGGWGQSGAVLTKGNRDQFANLEIASLSNFLFLQGGKDLMLWFDVHDHGR